MKKRLRADLDDTEIKAMYGKIIDRRSARAHHERIVLSAAIGVALVEAFPPLVRTVADLSTGEAAIVERIVERTGYDPILGDLAPGHPIEGPLPDTLASLPDEGVGLYVCCETLEHLATPRALLAQIRGRASRLLLSTPIGAWGDSNSEHIWAWDKAEIDSMLNATRWQPEFYAQYGNNYCFGIWGCV